MNEKFENIKILGKNINEFNKQHRGRCSIEEGQGIVLKGFWLAKDSDGNECGMFSLKNNELIETTWSKGEYGFVRCLSAGIMPTKKETLQLEKSKTEISSISIFKTDNSIRISPAQERKSEIQKKLPPASFWLENNMKNNTNKRKNTSESELNKALKYLNPYDDCDILPYKDIVGSVADIIINCARDYPEDLNGFMTYANSVQWSVLSDAVEKIKVNKYNYHSNDFIDRIVSSHEEAQRKSYVMPG